MKLFSFYDIVQTYKETNPNDFDSFYSRYCLELGKLVDLLKVTLTDGIRIQAVLNVPGIPQYIQVLLERQRTRECNAKTHSSPKSKKIVGATKQKSVPALNRPTALSNRRAKLLRPVLQGYVTPYPRVCKLPSCQTCQKLTTTVTLTFCSHGGKQHPHGWFPHLPDSVVASAHAGSEVVSPFQGITNPCVPVVPAVESTGTTPMEAEPSKLSDTVVDTQSEKKKAHKKKKRKAEPGEQVDEIPPVTSAERTEAFVKTIIEQSLVGGNDIATTLRLVDELHYERTRSILDYAKEVHSSLTKQLPKRKR